MTTHSLPNGSVSGAGEDGQGSGEEGG
jgi:hypothetical protein